MPELKEPTFKDIPIDFLAHPITGNVSRLYNREAVKQSVKNLVLTNFYERPYKALLGGDVRSQLFENINSITEYNISKNIEQVLNNYEPRAIIDRIVVQATPDENRIDVTITFQVRNDIQPVSVTIFLERVR